MKTAQLISFPINIRFIIYRDSLCIFLFSLDNNYKKNIFFRLTPDFWFNTDSQSEYLTQICKMLEDVLDLELLLNDKLIPSQLTTEINSYQLVIGKFLLAKDLIPFDKIWKRDFHHFSSLFESFTESNYIYIDYDVDYLGIFASTEKRNVGGYWNLDYIFYEKLGLSSFLENSVFDLDVRASTVLWDLLRRQIKSIFDEHGLKFNEFDKLYLGGITSEYLDISNSSFNLNNNLQVIKDLNFYSLLSAND